MRSVLEPSVAQRVTTSEVVRYEVGRKAIHLAATFGAALALTCLPPLQARVALSAVAGAALLVEVARHLRADIGRFFTRVVGTLLRESESRGITGATALALGFLIAASIAPPTIAAAGIMMAGVGDAAASIVGSWLGRHRVIGTKSVEGSLAYFIGATFAGALTMGGPLPLLLTTALVTTILEAASTRVDDNIILAPVSTFILLTMKQIFA